MGTPQVARRRCRVGLGPTQANPTERGFTLIEVLVALVIVAVAFAALLNTTAVAIQHTHQLKNRVIAHWVALQGTTFIQLGSVTVSAQQPNDYKTQLFHHQWYWQATVRPSVIDQVDALTIRVRASPRGPYTEVMRTFQVHHE